MSNEISRDHVEGFMKRERAHAERLRSELGSEVVDKLDRITLRDLIYERKERDVANMLGEGAASPDDLYHVIVSLRSGQSDPQRAARSLDRRARRRHVAQLRQRGNAAVSRLVDDIERRGGRIRQTLWLTHSVVCEVTSEQLAALAARNDVRRIDTNKHVVSINLDVSRPLIRADLVEVGGTDGTGINVAVLDSGVDFSHAALSAIAGGQFDFTNPPEGTGDLNGHGTHCAGVVASQDGKFRGIAPGATVHDYKHLNLFGRGAPADGIQAIQQAVADNMDVLSNSWGATHADGAWVDPDGTCVLCTAADNAVAAGTVFVVAAGNSNDDSCATYDTHIDCPGNARDAITIGASDDSDIITNFSSIGPTPDGRQKPDVYAPGHEIISARATTGNDMNGDADPVDDDWIETSGTSMACPHVAGLCALMLDRNTTLTPAEIKEILMSTAVDIGADVNLMGAGRVDAVDAVNAS